MESQSILDQLDYYYSHNMLDEAYGFLIDELSKAMHDNDDVRVLMILSELIGYDRVTANFKEGNMIAGQIERILANSHLENTLHGATSYLNIATFYRVEGKYQDSLNDYHKVQKLYSKLLDENDERYIAYYNNISLLYQEIGEYQLALDNELKALSLIEGKEDCEIETAITYTNLSQMYFSKNDKDKGLECLKKAIALFKTYGENDPHYFAALSSLGQYYYIEGDYSKAIDIYDDVLDKIESVYGQNKDYQTVLANKKLVEKEMNSKGLDLCQGYYEDYGKIMIETKFKDDQQYMAIGLFGFGSECLGYDDEISRDHDFGPGFCILLPKDIYHKIGEDLSREYENLPKVYKGMQRIESKRGQGRVGVFEIESYYKSFLKEIPRTLEDWLYVDENALLACTNGRVFEDDLGEVTKIREYLAYYPKDVWLKKIARALARMAQSGQYNYARCMQRGDKVASQLALNEFIDQTLSLIYLLNKKYKPYYKWSYYGLKDCTILKDIYPLIEELVLLPDQSNQWDDYEYINTKDKKVVLIEKICQRVVVELNKMHLSSSQDDYLDNHVDNVMSLIKDETIRNKHILEG